MKVFTSRLTLAAILLLGSAVLMGAGLAGLLMAGKDKPAVTNVGAFVTDRLGTGTATPLPTPPPNSSPLARMIIEKINVDASIITLGLDENFVPQVPDDPYVVSWYNFSSRPGWGSNAVFSGHVDWTIEGQVVLGVFFYLRNLELDDVITIVLEDGTEYNYKVIANRAVPYEDPEALAAMGPTLNDTITIITCGGTWVRDPSNPFGGNYTHRQIAQAELIRPEPSPSPTASPTPIPQ